MQSNTSPDMIQAMQAFAAALPGHSKGLVASAWVDDWGRFGNFQLMVVPVQADRYFTSRLKALLRNALPSGSHLRECFPPDSLVERDGQGRRRVVGRTRSSWVVDVDYLQYDAQRNTFS